MTHPSQTHRRTLVAALAVLGGAALLPTSAGALTARVSGDAVIFNDVGSDANEIEVRFVATNTIELRELNPNGPKLFGIGGACERPGIGAGDPRALICQSPGIVRAIGDLGSGDDRLTVTGLPHAAIVNGGQGFDSLRGGSGPDSLDPGPNHVAGREFVSGGPGDDQLRAEAVLTQGVSMEGGPGNDVLIGGRKDDLLRGGEGDDLIRAGEGDDQLRGEAGRDLLIGEDGSDELLAGDGESDEIVCGRTQQVGINGLDRDLAIVDLQDRLGPSANCSAVRSAPAAVHPTVRLLAGSVRVGGAIRVDLACPAVLAAPCAGTLRAIAVRGRAGRLLSGLGRADYSVAPGRRRTVRIALTDRARRALDASRRLRLISVEPGNELGPKTATITLEVPR